MKKQSPSPPLSGRKKLAVIGLLFCSLYTLSLFAPLVQGYTLYPLYLLKCGAQPISATKFAAAYSYTVPSSTSYSIGVFDTYFCAEQEAQDAGFRRYDTILDSPSPDRMKPHKSMSILLEGLALPFIFISGLTALAYDIVRIFYLTPERKLQKFHTYMSVVLLIALLFVLLAVLN